MAKYPEVHISEIRSYVQCPRLHNITSLERMGLEAINDRQVFIDGRLFHSVAERYYSPDYKGDWESYLWSLEEAGKFELDDLSKCRMLFKTYLEHIETAKRVKLPLNDNEFKWVAIETSFKWRPHRCSFEFAGRVDGIVQRVSTGKYYLWEHKTSSNPDGLVESLASDNQSRLYLKVARATLAIPIEGFIYNIVNKTLPEPPERLLKGGYSQAKSAKTSLSKFLATVPQEELVNYKDYLNFLRDFAEPKYFRRVEFIPSIQSIEECLDETMVLAKEIVSKSRRPVRIWNHWTCKSCPFKRHCYDGVPLSMITTKRNLEH